jgi:hypothetical protein
MSAIEGVRLDGLPDTPKIRKKLPTPFTRASITVGTPPQQRRRWMHLPATYVTVGDTVADLGVVSDIVENCEDPTEWTVVITGGQANTRTFHGAEPVWVFTTPGS